MSVAMAQCINATVNTTRETKSLTMAQQRDTTCTNGDGEDGCETERGCEGGRGGIRPDRVIHSHVDELGRCASCAHWVWTGSCSGRRHPVITYERLTCHSQHGWFAATGGCTTPCIKPRHTPTTGLHATGTRFGERPQGCNTGVWDRWNKVQKGQPIFTHTDRTRNDATPTQVECRTTRLINQLTYGPATINKYWYYTC